MTSREMRLAVYISEYVGPGLGDYLSVCGSDDLTYWTRLGIEGEG